MGNYPKTAPSLSFSEYQKKVEGRKETDSDALNPLDFKDVEPAAITSHMYPDLYSQAECINKDIDRIQLEMAKSVKELFDWTGDEAIALSIESIFEYVDNYLQLPSLMAEAGEEYTFTKKGIYNLHGEVYRRKELAKTMLDLYFKNNRLKEFERRKKLAKQNILL